jgi:rRNA maturation endonuclease Nob1
MRKITKLLTGVFRCGDCGSEYLFERVPEDRVECPDCGGEDLDGPEPDEPEDVEETTASPGRPEGKKG